jgi:hypothetical protein
MSVLGGGRRDWGVDWWQDPVITRKRPFTAGHQSLLLVVALGYDGFDA